MVKSIEKENKSHGMVKSIVKQNVIDCSKSID